MATKGAVGAGAGVELSLHLGYEKGDAAGNRRNGYSEKTVLTEDGAIDIAVPRDRNSTFEPVIVPKGERRLDGFDDRNVSLYARGTTVREIQGSLIRRPRCPQEPLLHHAQGLRVLRKLCTYRSPPTH